MYFYFKPTPTTQEEAKTMYRTLAQRHHPDKGGTTEAMQTINAEYAALLSELVKHAERKRQTTAHAEGRKTNADFIDLDATAEALRAKLEEILNLGMIDVNIELIGLWIWVSGNTKPYKEALGKNGLGLHWRGQKEAWTFEGVASTNRRPKPLEEIRAKYGSTRFESRPRQNNNNDALPA